MQQFLSESFEKENPKYNETNEIKILKRHANVKLWDTRSA